jgi:hypothetical protein
VCSFFFQISFIGLAEKAESVSELMPKGKLLIKQHKTIWIFSFTSLIKTITGMTNKSLAKGNLISLLPYFGDEIFRGFSFYGTFLSTHLKTGRCRVTS